MTVFCFLRVRHDGVGLAWKLQAQAREGERERRAVASLEGVRDWN